MRWIIAACIAICLLCTTGVQGKDNLTSGNGSNNSNQSFNLSKIGDDKKIDATNCTLWGDNVVNSGRYYNYAVRFYDRAISIDPNFIEAWNNKGVALYKMKMYKDALACFNKTIEIDPKNSIAWSNKGETLYRLGRTSESTSCLNRSLDLDLENAVALNNLGVIPADEGRYAEASDYFSRSIDVDNFYQVAWNNKGVVLARTEKYEDALNNLKNAVLLNENYTEAWINGGLVLKAMGREEKAKEAFDIARSQGYNKTVSDYVIQSEVVLMKKQQKEIPGFGIISAIDALFIATCTAWKRMRREKRHSGKI